MENIVKYYKLCGLLQNKKGAAPEKKQVTFTLEELDLRYTGGMYVADFDDSDKKITVVYPDF